MEHKLIRGGEQFLPFARSRIKALRATGMQYASQSFRVSGFKINTRISGDHDYIEITGGSVSFWVLLRAVVKTAALDNLGNRSFAGESLLLRIDDFSSEKVHVYHAGNGTATDFIPTTPPIGVFIGPGYEADWTPHLNVVKAFSPSAGKAVMVFVADDDPTGLRTGDIWAPTVPSTPQYHIDDLPNSPANYQAERNITTRVAIGDTQQNYTWSRIAATTVTYTANPVTGLVINTDVTVHPVVESGDALSAAPVFFRKPEAEYSLGLPAYAAWSSVGFTRADGAVAIAPKVQRVWPSPSDPGDGRPTWGDTLAPRSEDDPAYTRREVGWHKQGATFIQYGGTVYDRRMNNGFSLNGGTRTVALSYTPAAGAESARAKFVRWKNSSGDMAKIELCEQVDTTLTVLKEIDLLTLPSVLATAGIKRGLENVWAAGTGNALTSADNMLTALFGTAHTTGQVSFQMQLMPDQADVFDASAKWK